MTATQVLIIATVFSVAVAAPEIAAEFGTDPSRIGIFTGIVFAISVISTAAGGNATARLGGVRVSQVCLVFAGLAMLSAVLDGWWGLALAAVLLGLAMGPETPASSHLLSRAVPQAQRTWIFSVRQTGNQIGGIVASLLVPAVAAAYGWRASLGLLAAGCAIYAVLLEVERRALRAVDVPDSSERRTAIADSLRLVLHDRRLRRLALAAFTFCGMQVCLNGFFVSYAVEHLAMDLVAAGWLLSIAQAGGLLGRLGWGIVANRIGAVLPVLRGLGLAMSVAAAASALTTAAWPASALYVVAFLFGLTASGWNGIFLAEIARIAPGGRVAVVTGGVQVIAYSGLVATPLAFSGVVAISGSYSAAYLATAGLSLAGTMLLRKVDA